MAVTAQDDATADLWDEQARSCEEKPRRASGAPQHYHGHRRRLRDRFERAGGDALADYEVLELLLFRSIPRRDVKPLAKALITRFGGLAEVLAATPPELMKTDGVSNATAVDLKLIQAAAQRMTRERAAQGPIFSNLSAVIEHCRAAMADEAREQFRVLFLDRKNRLISDEIMGVGTVNHAPVYVREVVRRALELNATALILAHNHPSGDPTPSRADIDITREIVEAARPMGLVVHDHLVIGRERTASFRDLQLMPAEPCGRRPGGRASRAAAIAEEGDGRAFQERGP